MKYISQPLIIKTTCQVSLGIPNLQRTDLRLKASDMSRSEVTFSPHDLEFEHSPVLIYACLCTVLIYAYRCQLDMENKQEYKNPTLHCFGVVC